MDKNTLLADLDYASAIAKDGANTPLLGGPIGLMWGCLLVPTLVLHGLTLMGKTPLAIEQIGLVWALYGLTGGILSAVLGRRINKKAGASSHLNRLSSALGISMGITIFFYAVATVYVVLTQGLPSFMYSLIIVFAFGLACLHGTVLGTLAQRGYMKMAGLLAGILMVVCLFIIQDTAVYFVAAAGIIGTQIIPGLIELKQERDHG